jgi:hypothetical protein
MIKHFDFWMAFSIKGQVALAIHYVYKRSQVFALADWEVHEKKRKPFGLE